MKTRTEVVIPIGIFVVPLIGYFYAILYETGFLEHFGVSDQAAQLNASSITSTAEAFVTSIIISILIATLLAAIFAAIDDKIHPIDPKLKAVVDKTSTKDLLVIVYERLKLHQVFLATGVLFLIIMPLLIRFNARKDAEQYQLHPIIVMANNGIRYDVVRQYGTSLIVEENKNFKVTNNHNYKVITSQDLNFETPIIPNYPKN